MVGLSGYAIESTAQLAPVYAGLVVLLLVSLLGIVSATSLRLRLYDALKRHRQRFAHINRKGRPRPPRSVSHSPTRP